MFGLFDKYGVATRFLLLNEGEGGGEGGGGGGNNPPENEPGGEGGDAGDSDIKFTKEQFANKIKAEKANAKKSALQQVADDLGVDLEEAKTIIAAHKQAETDALSEADRLKRDAEQKDSTATATQAQAKLELLNARIDGKIVVATGLDLDDEGDQTKIARLRTLVAANLTVDSTPDEIAEEFRQAREDFPGLFDISASGGGEGNGGGGNNNPPHSDRGGPPRRQKNQPGGSGSKSGYEKGQERAKAAVGNKTGYTFLE